MKTKTIAVAAIFFATTKLAFALPGGGTCDLSIGLGETCVPASRYEIGVDSVALCTDANCSNPQVLGSNAATFDIASAAAGSALGTYATMQTLPSGTYSYVRAIINRTFTISGAANGLCGAQNSASLSIPNDNPGGLDAKMASAGLTWSDGAKTQLQIIAALPSPINISSPGLAPSISIQFNTQKSLMCILGAAYPAPPNVTISVQ